MLAVGRVVRTALLRSIVSGQRPLFRSRRDKRKSFHREIAEGGLVRNSKYSVFNKNFRTHTLLKLNEKN